jgi:hypothetical protein
MSAIHPYSHLGRGRRVETAPRRWAAAGNGGWGGGARGLGKQGGVRLCDAGCYEKPCRAFIGAGRWFEADILSSRSSNGRQ